MEKDDQIYSLNRIIGGPANLPDAPFIGPLKVGCHLASALPTV